MSTDLKAVCPAFGLAHAAPGGRLSLAEIDHAPAAANLDTNAGGDTYTPQDTMAAEPKPDRPFRLGTALSNFAQGLVWPIFSMLESPMALLTGVATIAAGGIFMALTGGVGGALLVALGGGLAVFHTAQALAELASARDGQALAQAFKPLGSAVSETVLTLLGAKPSLEAAGLAKNIKNPFHAFWECLTNLPQILKRCGKTIFRGEQPAATAAAATTPPASNPAPTTPGSTPVPVAPTPPPPAPPAPPVTPTPPPLPMPSLLERIATFFKTAKQGVVEGIRRLRQPEHPSSFRTCFVNCPLQRRIELATNSTNALLKKVSDGVTLLSPKQMEYATQVRDHFRRVLKDGGPTPEEMNQMRGIVGQLNLLLPPTPRLSQRFRGWLDRRTGGSLTPTQGLAQLAPEIQIREASGFVQHHQTGGIPTEELRMYGKGIIQALQSILRDRHLTDLQSNRAKQALTDLKSLLSPPPAPSP